MTIQIQFLTRLLISSIIFCAASGAALKPEYRLSPPFSNEHYSCRCIPLFDASIYKGKSTQESFALHQRLCELKTYTRSLQQHITLISELCTGSTGSVVGWCTSHADAIKQTIIQDVNKRLAVNWKQGERGGKASNNLELCSVLLYFENEQTMDVSSRAKVLADIQRYQQTHSNDQLAVLIRNYCWLKKTAEDVAESGTTLSQEVLDNFREFRWDALSKHLQTKALKEAIKRVRKAGSLELLLYTWDVLAGFIDNPAESTEFDILFGTKGIEQQITRAFIAVKEFTCITYVAYASLFTLSKTALDAPGYIRDGALADVGQLFSAVSELNALPIEQALDAINTLINGFAATITTLQQQADLVSWLKSKWVLIPLAVGVFVIRMVLYLWATHPSVDTDSEQKNIHCVCEGITTCGEHDKVS